MAVTGERLDEIRANAVHGDLSARDLDDLLEAAERFRPVLEDGERRRLRGMAWSVAQVAVEDDESKGEYLTQILDRAGVDIMKEVDSVDLTEL